MSTDPVGNFVQQLHQSQLLDAPQLAELDRLRPTATRPAQLASELVKRGWITPYQANQVALGRAASLIIGSYIVLEPLGGGGMGQVVKARHRFMQRNVALKLIRQDQRDSADIIERFQRETRLLADLRHPHIVHAYDAGLAGDVWFLAMELLEGTDLAVLVQQRGPLPVGTACEYVRQASLGLQHAHQRGLVHRDIKPSNLFVTAEGIKLLDLGLARPQAGESQGGLTQTNSVMGTPDYLAPEQAIDPRKAGTRSDLYSLGCTLYFLLSGRPIFPEGTLAQKLLFHQQAEPVPIEQLCPGVPPALAMLLRRMLAKRPEDRPANAAEVATQLTPFCTPASLDFAAAPPAGRDPLHRAPTATGQPLTDPYAPPAKNTAPSKTAAAPASGVFHSETILPTNQAPTLTEGHPAHPVRQAAQTSDTVLSSVAQPAMRLQKPFPIERKWLWSGAAGVGVLVLILTIVFWPSKKTKTEENGPVGSSATDQAAPAQPRWKEDRIIQLPGPAARVVPAGDGQFLVLHLKEERKLVVLDLLRGETVHELPGDDTIHFAAGAKQIVVLEPLAEKVRVYGLSDGKEQRSSQMPPAIVGKELMQVCMGSASEGPIYLYLPKEKRTLHLALDTMATTEVNWLHFGPQNAFGPQNLQPSPDGTVLLGYGGGWVGLCKATFKDGKQSGVTDKFEFRLELFALPSADGKWVFTARGMFSHNQVLVTIPHSESAYFVPAREPGYYLALLPETPRAMAEQGLKRFYWLPVQDPIVYSEDRQRLFVIPNCKELREKSTLRFEERIHYYPRAGMIAAVSANGMEVSLRRIPLPKSTPVP